MAKTLARTHVENQPDKAVAATHEFAQKVEKLMARDVVRMSYGMQYGEQNKYVAAYFTEAQVKKWGRLELLHITDVQFGHVACKEKRVGEYRDWVLAEPYRFMLWGGDMVDAATIFSPGSPWENICDPQGQTYRFVEMWGPARHRVLGYVGGNHERRGVKSFGDIGVLLASLLRIPYSAGRQYVDIHFGKHAPFKACLWHGRGAARTKGAKINMIDEFARSTDAQLCLVGHLHEAIMTFNWREFTDPLNHKIKRQKQAAAMSSSFLEYIGTYAEVAGMRATDVLMACARLEPDGHWELALR
jgi:hypothetical protein